MATPESNSKIPTGPGSAPKKGAGRFTPKGTATNSNIAPSTKAASDKGPAYANSGRYTPPVERTANETGSVAVTKVWVPWLMGLLMLIGGLLIVLNYVGAWPHSPSSWYLFGGIVAITGGFITATQLK
jgi:hypothetical protein